MKKIIGALLSVILLLSLTLSAFAAGDTVQAVNITGVISPVAGQKCTVSGLEIAIRVMENQGTGSLVPRRLSTSEYTVEAFWQEAKVSTPVATITTARMRVKTFFI